MRQQTKINIPGYKIEKTLGRGGMATVYLATQMSLGRPVALKILEDPETPQFFERFFNEGRCVARLNHSNLVSIFDIGQGDGFYYIAMEYLPGDHLKARIIQGIQPTAALRIIGQLANCLSYVHSEGIIHRDIKPSNILFRNDGTPVLTDFGIAKVIQSGNDLTVTGTVLGSPHYLSPEQAQENQKLDGRSDLYSLGVILFEMLTGRKPFTANSFAATLLAHIQNPIPRLPDPLAGLQPLLDKMLAKDPQERFQNGTELNNYLNHLKLQQTQNRRASDSTLASANSQGKKPTGAGKAGIWIKALLVGAVISTAIYALRESPSVEPESPLNTALAQSLPSAQAAPAERTPVPPDFQQPMADKPAAKAQQAGPAQGSAAVTDWLKQAELRLQGDRLTFPRGDSAYDFYRRVLEADPKNLSALAGQQRIAERYTQLAQAELKQGRPLKARRYINQGLRIKPEHSTLQQLSRQLKHNPSGRSQTTDPFQYLQPGNDR